MDLNAIESVVDAIDALVDDQMANYDNRSGYDHNVNQAVCALCGGAWHGTKWTPTGSEWLDDTSCRTIGCPGAYATGPQRIRFRHGRGWPLRLGKRIGQGYITTIVVGAGVGHVRDRSGRPPSFQFYNEIPDGFVEVGHIDEDAPWIDPALWSGQPPTAVRRVTR